MVRGTLVHEALERLFWNHGRGERTPLTAAAELQGAWTDLQSDPEYASLALAADQAEKFRAESETLVDNYFALEDPNEIETVGVEITLEARVGGVRLRGIIDRLDRRSDGELVVVDYKTGRAPSLAFEQSKLIGVQIYALLCQEVLGRRPVQVKLLHLKEPIVITAEPTEQGLMGQRRKTAAVWTAIERACEADDFRPHPGPLCNYCRFRPFCPAHGGDPADAIKVLGAGLRSGSAGEPVVAQEPVVVGESVVMGEPVVVGAVHGGPR